MPDFTIKAGDRLPIITGLLKNADGSAVDLTGCTVLFHMCKAADGTVVVNAPAVVAAPPTSGSVSYSWGATDTALPGSYYAEWQVTYPAGQLERFPNTDNLIVQVLKPVA